MEEEKEKEEDEAKEEEKEDSLRTGWSQSSSSTSTGTMLLSNPRVMFHDKKTDAGCYLVDHQLNSFAFGDLFVV